MILGHTQTYLICKDIKATGSCAGGLCLLENIDLKIIWLFPNNRWRDIMSLTAMFVVDECRKMRIKNTKKGESAWE